MRTLLLLRGSFCSGKDHFVKTNNLQDYTLSLDDFRTLLAQHEVCQNPETGEVSLKHTLIADNVAWQGLKQALELRMKNGLFTVINASHNNNDSLKAYSKLCEKYKYTMFYIQFDVENEVLLERNRQRALNEGRALIPEREITRINELIKAEPLYRANRIHDLSEIMHFSTINHDKVKVIGSIEGNARVLKEIMAEAKANPDTLYVFTGQYFGKFGNVQLNDKIAQSVDEISGQTSTAKYGMLRHVVYNLDDPRAREAEIGVYSQAVHDANIINTNGNHQIYKMLCAFLKNKLPNVLLLESVHESFIRDLPRSIESMKAFRENTPMFDVLFDIMWGERNELIANGKGKVATNINSDGKVQLPEMSDFFKENIGQVVSDLFQVYKHLKQVARIQSNGKTAIVSHYPQVAFIDEMTKVATNNFVGARPVAEDYHAKSVERYFLSFDKTEWDGNTDVLNTADHILISTANVMGLTTGNFVLHDKPLLAENDVSASTSKVIGLRVNLARDHILNDGYNSTVLAFDLANYTSATYADDVMLAVDAKVIAEKNTTGFEQTADGKIVWFQEVRDYKARGKNTMKRIRHEMERTQSATMNAFIEQGLQNGMLNIRQFNNSDLISINFNENAFETRGWDEVTTRARGLFINKMTGEIKIRSYNKFFNYNEVYATKHRALQEHLTFPVKVFHKYNGFLGIASVIDGELVLATKSQLNGPHVDMFKELMNNIPETERDALRDLLETNNASVMFEVCHLNDAHIIKYEQSNLYLLDFVKNTNGDEFVTSAHLDIQFSDEMQAKAKLVMPSMKFKELSRECANWEELEAVIDATNDMSLEIEGYVVQDAKGFLFKLKSKYYKTWKWMRHNLYNDNMKLGMSNNELEVSFLTWLRRNKSRIMHDLRKAVSNNVVDENAGHQSDTDEATQTADNRDKRRKSSEKNIQLNIIELRDMFYQEQHKIHNAVESEQTSSATE